MRGDGRVNCTTPMVVDPAETKTKDRISRGGVTIRPNIYLAKYASAPFGFLNAIHNVSGCSKYLSMGEKNYDP